MEIAVNTGKLWYEMIFLFIKYLVFSFDEIFVNVIYIDSEHSCKITVKCLVFKCIGFDTFWKTKIWGEFFFDFSTQNTQNDTCLANSHLSLWEMTIADATFPIIPSSRHPVNMLRYCCTLSQYDVCYDKIISSRQYCYLTKPRVFQMLKVRCTFSIKRVRLIHQVRNDC